MLCCDQALEQKYPCRALLLTATPQRGDSARYNLECHEDVAFFSRARAVSDKYIKQAQLHPVAVAEDADRESEGFYRPVMEKVAQLLTDKRVRCSFAPHRALFMTANRKLAQHYSTKFNELSEQRGWNLKSRSLDSRCIVCDSPWPSHC